MHKGHYVIKLFGISRYFLIFFAVFLFFSLLFIGTRNSLTQSVMAQHQNTIMVPQYSMERSSLAKTLKEVKIIIGSKESFTPSSTTTGSYNTVNQSSIDNYSTYQNSTYGIKIKYPTNWLKIEDKKTQKACVTNVCVVQQYGDVNFYGYKLKSPSKSPSTFGTLGIQIITFSYGAAPQKYKVACNMVGAHCARDLNSLVQNFTLAMQRLGFEITGSNATTIAGNPAYKVLVTGPLGTTAHIITQIATADGSQQYEISYPIAKWVSTPTIQKMLDSFEIVPSPKSAGISSLINETR